MGEPSVFEVIQGHLLTLDMPKNVQFLELLEHNAFLVLLAFNGGDVALFCPVQTSIMLSW